MTCSGCGCTDERACVSIDGETCEWVAPDLCSECQTEPTADRPYPQLERAGFVLP